MFLFHLHARAEARTQQERACQRHTRDQREQRKGQWPGSAHRGHDAIEFRPKLNSGRTWRTNSANTI